MNWRGSSPAVDLCRQWRTVALYAGRASCKGENPHAHLMISERANDGIERDAAQWFRRYNGKDPEKGGARKSMTTRPKDWLEKTRKDWAIRRTRRFSGWGAGSGFMKEPLDQQYRDALESGDELAAKRLKDQVPGVHIGPHNVARAERGVVLERTATAQAVEGSNQELKSDREEVEKMEGMLWRARAMVVQVAKQLAVKVRERFERSRGRDGPDHGWSR